MIPRNIVIGATGLVGSHVVIHLLKQQKNVVAVCRNDSSKEMFYELLQWYKIDNAIIETLLVWSYADVTDYFSIHDVIQENDSVYHCAALVSFNPKDSDLLQSINVEGTSNVVNACLEKNIGKLCYVSSVAVFSEYENKIFVDEESYWKPNGSESNYAKSKHLAEMEVWRATQEGLNAVVVNPSIIIGPHDFTKGSIKIIETVAKGLMVFTSGETGFVDVNDVAKVMIKLMHENVSEERFLLNGENISYENFFKLAANALHKRPPFLKVPNWLTGIAWRIEKVKAFIANQNPLITKETARAAKTLKKFSNQKIVSKLNYTFASSNEMLANACSFYVYQKEELK